ncbi:sensor histidine kinase [Glutamicibacter arilaitensis]|uniref:sensor histidine kinase n=1 Tax=Glutamicibacter arilaitensis TaxID=256701 RepID=UPI00186683B6|nr:histidine kinase [Glutamicibacter arilaitensis]
MRRLPELVHRRLPSLPPVDWERPSPDKKGLRRDIYVALGFLALALIMHELSMSLTERKDAPDRILAYLVLSALVLPLMFRRRWPITMMLIGSAAFVSAGSESTYRVGMELCAQLAYFIGIYTAVTWSKNRRGLWTAMSVVLLFMATWVIASFFASDLFEAAGTSMVKDPAGVLPVSSAFILYNLLMNLMYFGGAIFLGMVSWTNAYGTQIMKVQAQRIADQAQQLADRAVNEERLRIARELHDVIAHHIASVGVQASAARMVHDRDPAQSIELMRGIEDSARSAVGETRALLGVLREHDGPESAADSSGGSRNPEPSMAQLEELLAANKRQGLSVQLSTDEHQPGFIDTLPAGLSLALYRICGEALANVRAHSTARTAVLSLRSGTGHDGTWVEVEVTDSGRPRPDSGGGEFGLRGIRERANLHHGVVEIGPRVPHGWRTRARLRVVSDAATKLVS